MAVETTESTAESGQYTRAEVIRPFLRVLLAILAAMVVAGLLGRGTGANIIANLLLIVLVLCPLALCMFPVYMVVVFLIVNMQRLHRSAALGLGKLNGMTVTASDTVNRQVDRWARHTIRFNALFAGLDRGLFSLFDRPTRDEAPAGEEPNELR